MVRSTARQTDSLQERPLNFPRVEKYKISRGKMFQALTTLREKEKRQHILHRRLPNKQASDIITPLTHVAFVYNGPKGMELAHSPRYSGGS